MVWKHMGKFKVGSVILRKSQNFLFFQSDFQTKTSKIYLREPEKYILNNFLEKVGRYVVK